jgi:hypothetical protein
MDAFELEATTVADHKYLLVRYEDIVAEPALEMRKIAEFLGLSWSSSLSDAVGSIDFDTSRRRAFDTDLSRAQLDELTAVLGPSLSRYGYD